MALTTRSVVRVFSLFLLLLLLINIFPLQSLAAENVYEGEIELTGKFNGKFTLDSSSMELFNLNNVVPGDTWKGKLRVKNSCHDDMKISIVSIVNNLEDSTLYDALDLKISLGEEEIYNGSYGATQEPISDYYRIRKGERITFDLVVSLPKTAGNNLQNKQMDSTWTFEAMYFGSSNPGSTSKVEYTVYYVDEDGNELLNRKTGKGFAGVEITETARTIAGYTPNVEKSSIVLSSRKENKIVFVYSLNKDITDEPTDPVEPSDPIEPGPTEPDNPSEGDTPSDEPIKPSPDTPKEPSKDPTVQTGFDMTNSNSMGAVWLFVFFLCLAGGVVLYFRIRAEKIKGEKHNSNGRRT